MVHPRSPCRVTEKLTFTWAEAIFPVSCVVGCGGAPGQVVCAALGGARGVRFALENEGKVAKRTLRVPVERLHDCGGRRAWVWCNTKNKRKGETVSSILVSSGFTWAFSQSPELIIVKVSVSLHARTRRVSVGQKSVLAIKRVWVPVI